MINIDEDALICDLAETYSIFDYKSFSPIKISILANGLSINSRIKMRLNNQNVRMDELLLAGILDRLSLLVWFKTKDGQKGTNRPFLITELLTKDDKNNALINFNNGKDFEIMRNKLIEGV